MLHDATVQGMPPSKFLWSWAGWRFPWGELFTAHLSPWSVTTHAGEGALGQGPPRAGSPPALGFQAQRHQCPHRRPMPTLGGIRSAASPEPDREAAAHRRVPGTAPASFLWGPRKCGRATGETRAFPWAQDAPCKLARPLRSRREPRSPQPGVEVASLPRVSPALGVAWGRTYR